MKKTSFIPVVALSALLLAGCPKETPSSGNALLDALNNIEVGNVKKKVADKLFKSETISASDDKITKAMYQEDLFMPYWWYGDSQEEDYYAENVKRSSHITEYEVYDNDVIHLTDYNEVYGYDPSTITPDDDDGVASEPTIITGDAFVFRNENDGDETLDYIYTRNEDPKNPYSFRGSMEFDEYLFEEVKHKGGLGNLISQAKEDVEDTFNSFAAQVSDWERVEEFKAVKNEDGSFDLTFTGDLCMPFYSAELVWGWEHGYDEEGEEDYNILVEKTTNQWDGIYVNRSIRCQYVFNISKDAVVTYGETTYLCYHTQILKDPAPEEEQFSLIAEDDDHLLTYPLSKKATAILKERCIVPEKIEWTDLEKDASGEIVEVEKSITNPYADPEYKYDEGLPYNTDYFKGSNEKLGNYAEELPQASKYRRQRDRVDVGIKFWVNAYELLMEEH